MAKSNERSLQAPVTERSICSLMGLSMRQGAVESGSFLAEKSIKGGTAKLVVIAEDASDNTKKDFTDMCTYYHVPYAVFGTKDTLGHAIGKEFRVVMALTNPGLSEKISEQIKTLLENRINDK